MLFNPKTIKEINEKIYGKEKEKEFSQIYEKLTKEFDIQLHQENDDTFLGKWYINSVREEIDFVFKEIKKIKNSDINKVASIVLSRTIRSCRATTHADLATLKDPMTKTYYCVKHGKICKPLFSIYKLWRRYSKDTIKRINDFERLRTETHQICLTGDSRNVDIFEEIKKKNSAFGELLKKQKIKGIFSSPPYVGLINYHEQHAYAYDLFGLERRDEMEIGPLYKGKGKEAKKSYVEGISSVLNNCKKFLVDNYDVFLVANDKHELYPLIADNSGMKIVNQYKRPVLNRTEKDRAAYAEIIFHLKEKG